MRGLLVIGASAGLVGAGWPWYSALDGRGCAADRVKSRREGRYFGLIPGNRVPGALYSTVQAAC